MKLSDIISLKTQHFSPDIQRHITAYIKQYKPKNYLFFTRQSPQITSRRIQQILNQYNIEPQRELRKQQLLEQAKTHTAQELKKQFNISSLREKVILSEKEQEILLSHASQRDYCIINLMLETGITLQQLVTIKRTNLQHNTLRITTQDHRSSQQQEQFTLSQSLSSALAQFPKNTFLFGAKNGHISGRRIQQLLKQYSSLIDKELTPQVLRNTFLANAVKEQPELRNFYEGYHCGGELV
jgi:hypothetical protein